ncbi:MAG: F0F1 ATP synthase subunit epsilon [Clostridia bacterium]|nr:F0F1 ATP synthase subunit epsilon [Clostridia bacterium]
MSEEYRFCIYTPEKIVLEGMTESLVLQGLDGQLCVQAHHMPALFALDTGYIRVKQNGAWRQLVSTEGYVDVNYNRAYIFVDHCIEEDDAEKAEAELQRLKATERRSVREHKRSAIKLARTLAELNAKDKRRRTPKP